MSALTGPSLVPFSVITWAAVTNQPSGDTKKPVPVGVGIPLDARFGKSMEYVASLVAASVFLIICPIIAASWERPDQLIDKSFLHLNEGVGFGLRDFDISHALSCLRRWNTPPILSRFCKWRSSLQRPPGDAGQRAAGAVGGREVAGNLAVGPLGQRPALTPRRTPA